MNEQSGSNETTIQRSEAGILAASSRPIGLTRHSCNCAPSASSFIPYQLPAGRPISDIMISSWPTALLIQRTFAQMHQLPLWNPYYGGGQPLAADPLATFFYPPMYLVLFLSLRRYFLLLIIGHLVFAGLGMLLLARRAVGLPRFPALVAAV